MTDPPTRVRRSSAHSTIPAFGWSGKPSSAGLATRLNQAVALSRGEFIARMDADDICFPERLARQVERLQQDPTARRSRLRGGGLHQTTRTSSASCRSADPSRRSPRALSSVFRFRTRPGADAQTGSAPILMTPNSCMRKTRICCLRTFRHSRFGALETVLLGYRQDRLAVGKLVRGAEPSLDRCGAMGGVRASSCRR